MSVGSSAQSVTPQHQQSSWKRMANGTNSQPSQPSRRQSSASSSARNSMKIPWMDVLSRAQWSLRETSWFKHRRWTSFQPLYVNSVTPSASQLALMEMLSVSENTRHKWIEMGRLYGDYGKDLWTFGGLFNRSQLFLFFIVKFLIFFSNFLNILD